MDDLRISAAKARARALAAERRAACDPAQGARLTENALREYLPPAGAIVAGYWPISTEIDIRPLLHALHARGYQLCLPEAPPRGNALIFRAWQPGTALVPGRFGTLHPVGEVLRPNFFLVPLLAFDAMGNRLGYGGGYYDRTFAEEPDAFRLGCAFSAQEVHAVPAGSNDVKLHAFVTELPGDGATR